MGKIIYVIKQFILDDSNLKCNILNYYFFIENLEVIEKISDISTRLVANKVSFKFKKDEIMNLVTKLETVTEGK